MRVAAAALAILGGLFVLLAVNPGSVTTHSDAEVMSDWVTLGAGVVAIGGGAVLVWRPLAGVGLIALAFVAGGLSAQNMTPAIQDMLIIPYFLAALLLAGALITGVIAAAIAKPSRGLPGRARRGL